MEIFVGNLAEHPELAHLLDDFPGAWPEFLQHQAVSDLFYDIAASTYAAYCLVAVDRADPRRAVAKAYSMPVSWDLDPAGGLPAHGHDAVILQAAADRLARRSGRIVGAVEVTVQTTHRGLGLSRTMLAALRANASTLGHQALIVPVRPTEKHQEPETSMHEYAYRTRDDGLPVDPWLRVHVRAGGRIVGVAPCSMTMAAPLADWRTWTGLPFDATGPVLVPDALVPVYCDVDHDQAVYVEPNVWVHHPV